MLDEKTYNQKIAEVISTFDFLRVKHVMEYLNWNWAEYSGIPGERELIEKATALLNEIRDKPGGVCGSGGFRASYRENGILSLKFILTESWSDSPDDDDI